MALDDPHRLQPARPPPPAMRVEAMRERDVAAVAAFGGPTAMTEGQLRDELARTWSREWVVREEGEGAIAFLVAWHVADELHVLNVTTRADRRRRGAARALLTAALDYARAHGVKHVVLEARRSNAPALTLYRTLGFFATGLRRRYYPDDEDAVEMTLLFDGEAGGVVVHGDEVDLH